MTPIRPVETLQRFLVRRAQARERGASLRGIVDFAIAVTGLGAAAMVAAAFGLRSPTLGLEFGSRLAFALFLLLAVRPWTPR